MYIIYIFINVVDLWGGVTIYILYIYIYNLGLDMGSALWKHLGTNPCSTPRLHWLHLYTTEQQPGTALMTLAVLQEKAVVFVHLILQHHQSSPTSSSPMTPKRHVQSFAKCPIQLEQHRKIKSPTENPGPGSVSRTVISLCNSVLRRLCASCSVWCACSSLSKPWVVQ